MTKDTEAPAEAHDPEQAPDFVESLAERVAKIFGESARTISALLLANALCTRYEGPHDSDPDTDRLEPEADPAGYITLGYGRLLRNPDTGEPLRDTANGWRLARRQYPNGITKEHAKFLLASDLLDVKQQIFAHVDPESLTPAQLAALMSFVYNLGITAFTGSTLFQKVQQEGTKGPFELEFSFADLYKAVSRKVPLTNFALAWTAWCRFTNDRGLRVVSGGLFARRYAEFLLFSCTVETADEAIKIADEEYRDMV